MTDLPERRQNRRLSLCAVFSSSMLFLVLSMILIAPGSTQAELMAQVRISPVAQTIGLGSTVSVDISIDAVTDLYGAEVHLTFDPGLLAVQDVDLGQPGIQIALGPELTSGTYFVAVNQADNVSGTIDLAVTQLNPTPPVSTTSGILAHIDFQTLAIGQSPVGFSSATLANRNGLAIPSLTQNGAITIVAVPASILVQVNPSTLVVNTGDTALITATVLDTHDQPIAGSLLTGSLTPTSLGTVSGLGTTNGSGQAFGLWTVGNVTGTGYINITNNGITGTAMITVSGPSPELPQYKLYLPVVIFPFQYGLYLPVVDRNYGISATELEH